MVLLKEVKEVKVKMVFAERFSLLGFVTSTGS